MPVVNNLDDIIAKRLREERLARRWTLDRLAAESAVSRAMISKIERNQSSPTAVLLTRLASAMKLSLTSLMSERGAGSSAVRRLHEQAVWMDPETKYVRRLISGREAEVDIVAVELPPGAVVEFDGAENAVCEEQVFILEGTLTLHTGESQSSLDPGDLARFASDKVHTFANHGHSVARYLVMKRQL
jgi:transcriptional regulator with XRE-family HTH domain